MNGEQMAAEIREQPDVYRRLLTEGRGQFERVAGAVRAYAPRFALLAARGTSDHAALYAKYLIETRLNLPAGLVSPSTVTLYGARPRARDVLFIAVSQSGVSPDLVESMVAARAAGALTVAVTNAPDSPLTRAAEHQVDVLAGTERAVAATKSYTAELLALYLLIESFRASGATEAGSLPDLAAQVLALESQVAGIAGRYRFADQLVVTSRGYNYATAREAALKLMETAYVVAHAFSGADLLHGPLAMIRRGFPVIAIVPRGKGGDALRPVLGRLREQGADIFLVGATENAAQGTIGLEMPADVCERLSPLLLILPLQQLAWHMAMQRGLDPDQPAGLQKITETR